MTIFARVGNILSLVVSSVGNSPSCRSVRLIMPFYAVSKGHQPGIYTEWSECKKQTDGFRGPQFKKFPTKEEAEEFIVRMNKFIIPASNGASKQAKEKAKKEESTGSDSGSSSAAKGTKRARSPEADDKGSEYGSAIKKRTVEKPVPDKDLFTVNEDGEVVVYTDGCCEGNGKQGARAGVGVYFGPENPLNVAEPVRGRATNNTAEIQAISYALELIKHAGFKKALINTDSQFVISCMTQWMTGWKKRGWKKSDGSPVINKADLIDLEGASKGIEVKYNHVKAHSGIHGNEMADQLAKEGSKTYDADVTK